MLTSLQNDYSIIKIKNKHCDTGPVLPLSQAQHHIERSLTNPKTAVITIPKRFMN